MKHALRPNGPCPDLLAGNDEPLLHRNHRTCDACRPVARLELPGVGKARHSGLQLVRKTAVGIILRKTPIALGAIAFLRRRPGLGLRDPVLPIEKPESRTGERDENDERRHQTRQTSTAPRPL